ncbi:MAG: flagellar hook-length control protein FliK [Methyloprofundus sp.]|nr:flagellar hook-length control protein FliK [Methyloprofundus sp.]MBW6452476.1 flagellar hook-length control protein FliK [Methyloprofundus sp.]
MINLAIPAQAQHLLNTLSATKSSTENLKIGQQIDARVIQISQDTKTIQLSIDHKKIAALLKNDTPASKQHTALLQSGQTVTLIVIKLAPQTEVKILLPEQLLQANKTTSNTVATDIQRNAPTLILKTDLNNAQTTLSTANTQLATARTGPQILPAANTADKVLLSTLKAHQLLSATVISSDPKNLKLRLFIPASNSFSNTQFSQQVTSPPKTTTALPITAQSQATTIQPNTTTQGIIESIKTPAFITPKPTSTQPAIVLSTTTTTQQTSALINTAATPKALIIDFPASKSIPLPTLSPQQAIVLQVSKTGAQLQFQILPPKSPEQTISSVLRQLLPKEIATPELVNQLSRDVPQIISHEKVSETLKRLAQQILRDLPKSQQLTEAAQLKKSLDNSGLYLEAKLAANTGEKTEQLLNSDFKALLLKFTQALQHESQAEKNNLVRDDQLSNLLKDLQSKSEGALARLILNQLKSLPQEDQNKQVWVMDLPFTEKKQTTSIKIEIEKNHKKFNKTEQKTWSASITLSPPHLNTLHCKISYFNNAVHTNFWSEDTKTTKLIQDNLDYLTARFEAEGLTPGNMNAAQQSTNKPQTPLNIDKRTLFDDNA